MIEKIFVAVVSGLIVVAILKSVKQTNSTGVDDASDGT